MLGFLYKSVGIPATSPQDFIFFNIEYYFQITFSPTVVLFVVLLLLNILFIQQVKREANPV